METRIEIVVTWKLNYPAIKTIIVSSNTIFSSYKMRMCCAVLSFLVMSAFL